MARLIDELKLAFTAEFRTFAASLESRLDGIQLAVTDHTQRLASVDRQILVEIMGKDVLPEPPELDRCHRMLTPKPAPGSRPRAVIARLHRYRIKETIILEARKRRGKLTYKGKPILIFEDYCPEVVEQRARYRDVMGPLYQRGFKQSLQFQFHAEDFLKTRP
ncbi:hypothetical protein NHX12_016794 [Muraenolepis orangiensis]|uniref:Transposase n=1 Tax=Muraenolepis orangiensis TaxID=630683 RepID=A0A9Q0I0N0_9TELE|nr:hypothetical protein NHX12_016794 [Muraenolepis orangiensis]